MLSDEQTMAYDVLLPHLAGSTGGVFLLEGYAGTGKTYLVARLLDALAPKPLRIAVAAPTNKAVRVARDMLVAHAVPVADAGDEAWGLWQPPAPAGITCRTLHSLLGLKLRERADGRHEAVAGRRSTLRDYDVVVIDEASMVSGDLARRVHEERHPRARILYVGDPAQLAPVVDQRDGNGSRVEPSPIFRDTGHLTARCTLKQIVRQAEGNPIIRLSVEIRKALDEGRRVHLPDLHAALGAVPADSPVIIDHGGRDAALASLLDARDFDPNMDCRIVAYTNDRVMEYNMAAHQVLYPGATTPFCPGEVTMLQSQFEIEEGDRLLNSEELTVVRCEPDQHPHYRDVPGTFRLRARRECGDDVEVFLVADRLALNARIDALFREKRTLEGWALRKAFCDLRHAYAITAHKAQGSTFDAAIIDFQNLRLMADPVEFGRCLYVAVTRSRNFLVIAA